MKWVKGCKNQYKIALYDNVYLHICLAEILIRYQINITKNYQILIEITSLEITINFKRQSFITSWDILVSKRYKDRLNFQSNHLVYSKFIKEWKKTPQNYTKATLVVVTAIIRNNIITRFDCRKQGLRIQP